MSRVAQFRGFGRAVARFRRAVEAGDELAQVAALTDLDALKNRARGFA
jgi:hypothetical protein